MNLLLHHIGVKKSIKIFLQGKNSSQNSWFGRGEGRVTRDLGFLEPAFPMTFQLLGETV